MSLQYLIIAIHQWRNALLQPFSYLTRDEDGFLVEIAHPQSYVPHSGQLYTLSLNSSEIVLLFRTSPNMKDPVRVIFKKITWNFGTVTFSSTAQGLVRTYRWSPLTMMLTPTLVGSSDFRAAARAVENFLQEIYA